MARIPSFTCKEGCHECCGLVPFTTAQSAMLDGIPPITAFMGMEG